MRHPEYAHNTREQVVEYIGEAAKVVAELELDDDLKVPAFVKAIDLLAAKQITLTQVAPMGVDLRTIPRQRG